VHYNDRWFSIVEFPLSVPTAIISIYTKEGFVIAADGRDYDHDSGIILSDSVQKIYPVQCRRGHLAYCFTGTDKIRAKESSEVLFDFIEASSSSALVLDATHPTLGDYTLALSRSLFPLPDAAAKAIARLDKPPQETIIFVEGYYAGAACRAVLKISHDGQAPRIQSGPAGAGMPLGTYPIKVRDAISDSNSPLHKYWTQISEIETMSAAMTAAWNLIGAAMDPHAIEIDSRCKGIGGWSHMAVITPEGFKWIKEPLR
jgi:hypothetical protein